MKLRRKDFIRLIGASLAVTATWNFGPLSLASGEDHICGKSQRSGSASPAAMELVPPDLVGLNGVLGIAVEESHHGRLRCLPAKDDRYLMKRFSKEVASSDTNNSWVASTPGNGYTRLPARYSERTIPC